MPAPSWTPDDLGANLTAWWKADALALADAAAVASFTDASGNDRHLTQGTGANQPTFQTGEINGLPVVRWDGSDDSMAAADTGIAAQPWSFAMVVRLAAANGAVFHNGATVFVGRSSTVWTFLSSSQVILSGADASTTDYRIITGIINGVSSLGSFNGTAVATADAGSAFLESIQIGPELLDGVFSGDLPELFLGDTAWNEATRQNAEGYLAWKYGLTAALPADHPYVGGGGRSGLRYALGTGLRQRTLGR